MHSILQEQCRTQRQYPRTCNNKITTRTNHITNRLVVVHRLATHRRAISPTTPPGALCPLPPPPPTSLDLHATSGRPMERERKRETGSAPRRLWGVHQLPPLATAATANIIGFINLSYNTKDSSGSLLNSNKQKNQWSVNHPTRATSWGKSQVEQLLTTLTARVGQEEHTSILSSSPER